jgi:predicted MPP superfamily phosphohydrolase
VSATAEVTYYVALPFVAADNVAVRVPSRVALQLSGHIHGGQVRLLGWSPVAPSGQRLAYGHIRMKCDVVVSGGLGCSIMPFRLGVPPEIVLVTLGGNAEA